METKALFGSYNSWIQSINDRNAGWTNYKKLALDCCVVKRITRKQSEVEIRWIWLDEAKYLNQYRPKQRRNSSRKTANAPINFKIIALSRARSNNIEANSWKSNRLIKLTNENLHSRKQRIQFATLSQQCLVLWLSWETQVHLLGIKT